MISPTTGEAKEDRILWRPACTRKRMIVIDQPIDNEPLLKFHGCFGRKEIHLLSMGGLTDSVIIIT